MPAYVKKGRFHKGSCAGLRAWGMARLVEVKEAGSSSRGKDKVRAYFRTFERLCCSMCTQTVHNILLCCLTSCGCSASA